jgi:3'-phosphoadenosine 5'-phosphosulfate sulfotransferase (PAPS reductase)/FAD synthetase
VSRAAYLLPPGNVQVCFSGGRTSGFLLHRLLEANGGLPADRCEVVFTNTGLEHPATLDFVAEVAERWAVPITWLEYELGGNSGEATFRVVDHATAARDGRPMQAAIDHRGFLPNQAARFCTVELKGRTASRYLREARGWTGWHAALGIRKDEPRRLKKTRRDDAGRIVAERRRERGLGWYPLAQAGVGRRDVAAFWSAQPFDLALPAHDGKTPAGNCVGCYLKSEKTLAGLWRDMPEHMEWWRQAEARAAARWAALPEAERARLVEKRLAADLRTLAAAYAPDPIPADVLAAAREVASRPPTFSKRYTHAQLADMVARQGWLLEAEGALCQAEAGECLGEGDPDDDDRTRPEEGAFP